MKAILRTYHTDGRYDDRLVDVRDDHQFGDGPYGDGVPFAVGSNQDILPVEDADTLFDIIDHGIDHSEYFQGFCVSHTVFDHAETGCGETPAEALDDALEQIAMTHGDKGRELIEIIETSKDYVHIKEDSTSVYQYLVQSGEITDGDDYPDGCDLHYYVSIRYNL